LREIIGQTERLFLHAHRQYPITLTQLTQGVNAATIRRHDLEKAERAGFEPAVRVITRTTV
jgi:hypothetical protein